MKRIKHPCKSCPFEGSDPLILSPEKRADIVEYLNDGVSHLCHSDRRNQTICEGGRHLQLKMWAARGMIKEPTDEALCEAMIVAGVAPAPFQYGVQA